MLDKLLDALDSVVWYNCHYYKLEALKRGLIETKEEYSYKYDYGDDDQFQVIWMILVCIFGDYGTSPRSGWLLIENKNEIIKFIELLETTAKEADEI